MSKASDLINQALTANQSQASALTQLLSDQTTLDAATTTQATHAANAATQADQDAKAVSDAQAAIGTDLQKVSAAQTAQAAAVAALANLAVPLPPVNVNPPVVPAGDAAVPNPPAA